MLAFFGALTFLMQAAPSAVQATETKQTSGALLWRDLRVGMNVEEVATSLRAADGIASVRGVSKPNKPPKLDIDYAAKGVPIGSLIVSVTPVFENGLLSSVVLISDVCSSEALVNIKAIAENLKEKYGSSQRMTVVDDNGVKIDEQFAFYNGETRVSMAFKSRNDANYSRAFASGKLGGSLAKLANSMNESAAQAAIDACPIDRGERTTTSLTYASQAAFATEHAQEEAARTAKANALKNGL